MLTYIREIGPEDADKLLENNYDKNRKISEATVYKYARAMDEGRYESLNGQTIVLGTDGKLYDGQHRLAALSLAEVTLPFLFVVDENAAEHFGTVDQGRARLISQFGHIKLKTISDYVAKVGFCLDRGSTLEEALTGRLPASIIRITNTRGDAPKPRPDMMEVLNWENEHLTTIETASVFGRSLYDAIGTRLGKVGPSIFAAAAYIILRYSDSSKLEAFRCAFTSDVTTSRPAIGLTKSIRGAAREGKLTRELALGFIFTDYTYFLNGEDKKANATTAINSYDYMARKIKTKGGR